MESTQVAIEVESLEDRHVRPLELVPGIPETPDAFIAWAMKQGKLDGQNCPLENYLISLGMELPLVNSCEYEDLESTEDFQRTTPEWAAEFIREVDNRPGDGWYLTGAEAAQIAIEVSKDA